MEKQTLEIQRACERDERDDERTFAIMQGNNPNPEKETKVRLCKRCGNPIVPSKYSSRRVYCSDECATLAKSEAGKALREQKYAGKRDKPCKMCGKIFHDDGRANSRYYCSDECKKKAKFICERLSFGMDVGDVPEHLQRLKDKWMQKEPQQKKRKKSTFDATYKMLLEKGIKYADYQKAQTLAMVKKIDTNI